MSITKEQRAEIIRRFRTVIFGLSAEMRQSTDVLHHELASVLNSFVVEQPEPQGQSPTEREATLAMTIKQLAYRLGQHDPSSSVRKNALDLLRRYGLMGSPLRSDHIEAEHGITQQEGEE